MDRFTAGLLRGRDEAIHAELLTPIEHRKISVSVAITAVFIRYHPLSHYWQC